MNRQLTHQHKGWFFALWIRSSFNKRHSAHVLRPFFSVQRLFRAQKINLCVDDWVDVMIHVHLHVFFLRANQLIRHPLIFQQNKGPGPTRPKFWLPYRNNRSALLRSRLAKFAYKCNFSFATLFLSFIAVVWGLQQTYCVQFFASPIEQKSSFFGEAPRQPQQAVRCDPMMLNFFLGDPMFPNNKLYSSGIECVEINSTVFGFGILVDAELKCMRIKMNCGSRENLSKIFLCLTVWLKNWSKQQKFPSEFPNILERLKMSLVWPRVFFWSLSF